MPTMPPCGTCGAPARLRHVDDLHAPACNLHWSGSRTHWVALSLFAKGELLRVLARVESVLPDLLDHYEGWETLDVDYEPPRVERLWTPFGDFRVYLHRIHPCEKALFHPHPWPSAVTVLSGRYEMGVGYSADNDKPAEAATVVLSAGSYYEMVEPNGWHYVRPIGGPSYSVMVTGEPWSRWSPSPTTKLQPLSETSERDLLEKFRSFYPKARP